MTIRQGPYKSLKSYLMLFNQEKLIIESQTEEFVYYALYQCIKKDGPLIADLARKSSRNLQGFMDRAEEFINQEETLRALLGAEPAQAPSLDNRKKKMKHKGKEPKGTDEHDPIKRFQDYDWTPLNASAREVLLQLFHPNSTLNGMCFHQSHWRYLFVPSPRSVKLLN